MTIKEKNTEIYELTKSTLQQIKQKIIELSACDLSSVHIGTEWTWVPYLNDHLQFLIQQVEGLELNLFDTPPPTILKEIQHLNDINKNILEQEKSS